VTNPNDINTFIPGAQRYYIHYATTGSVAATNVTVKFPLPAHTAFYRASFVSLAPNKDKNKADLGYLPGKLISTPSGDSIIPPAGAANGFLATSGVVTFGFSKLAAGAKGDLMVELIVTADAIDQHGSYVGGFDANSANVTIQDSTVSSFGLVRASLTPDVGSHSASAPVAPQQVSSPGNVPQIGILKHVPGEVKAGSNFDMIITVWNYGDTPVSTPVIEYMIPSQNAEFVQMTYGSMTSGTSGITTPGSVLDQNVATNNAPVTGYPWELGPHQSAAITLTYKATGAAGSTIVDNGTKAFAPYCGYVNADITETHITAGTPSSAPLIVLTNSPGHLNLDDNTILIDLRGGNALAVGASGIVAQGGGNIVAQGGGNIVAQGGGNLLPLSSAFASGNNTVGAALTNRSSIVAQGGGNFWATPAAGIVAQGGGNIVAQGGGNIVAAGAGNIVAQGGGNIVAQGGGNIVAQGGGNIVAQGGGNIVAQGGGNFIAVGGGIVAQGGGNIVAQGGGNLVASLANSAALIRTQAGGLISSGGGNFHPTP